MVECLKKAFFEQNMEDILKYSKNLRKNILYMAKVAGSNSSHIGGALSCIDLISVLFKKYFDFKDINNQDRDRFILSKGHAATAQYVNLAHKGFISKKKLNNYTLQNSHLEEHPNPSINGVEAATGSLGHGLPIGCGIALAAKIKKKKIQNSCAFRRWRVQ